jgi:hypothetical protein
VSGRRVARGVALVGVVTVWAVLRSRALLPAVGSGAACVGALAGGAAAIAAWGLVAGLLAWVAARGARRLGLVPSRARTVGWLALVGTVALGVVLRRLPDRMTWGVGTVLGQPWAGDVWVDTESTGTAQAVLLAWTLVDLLGVVTAAWLTWRALERRPDVGPRASAAHPPARAHVGVALAAAVVLAVVLASLAGTLADTSAGLDAAAGFLAVNPLPAVALVVGIVAVGRGFDRPAAIVLGAAWVLDTLAGLVGTRDAISGPHRLQVVPVDEAFLGVQPTTGAVLALAALTVAVCVPLLLVGPAARATRVLETRSAPALWIGLAANTVDALATGLGLRSGAVEEANPLVRAGGLGVKWIVVTVLFVVLHRLRPRLVWLVTVAYLLVVAYHLVGGLLLA